MLKNNNIKFFFHKNFKPLFITIGLFIGMIVLFILVTIILKTSSNVSELFKLDYQLGLQMIITGFNLGVSSYLMQRITKNQLTDTSVMGFGSVNLIPLSILALMTNFSGSLESNKPFNQTQFLNILPLVFIVVSMSLTSLFHFFSKQQKLMNHKRLLIAGVILNFICIAIAISVKSKLDYLAAPKIQKYIVGFVSSTTDFRCLMFCLVISLLGFVWLLLISPKLKLLIINQQLGIQVGIDNSSIHLQSFLIIGLFVGVSYSLTGDFVFVGLLAGNIAFMMFKNKFIWGVFGSGFIGAIIVLLTYFVFSNCINIDFSVIPQLIPLLISPYFLFLLIRGNKNV